MSGYSVRLLAEVLSYITPVAEKYKKKVAIWKTNFEKFLNWEPLEQKIFPFFVRFLYTVAKTETHWKREAIHKTPERFLLSRDKDKGKSIKGSDSLSTFKKLEYVHSTYTFVQY